MISYPCLQFSQQLIETAALVVSNCLTGNVDLYMRLHHNTSITEAFTSYFNHPNSIVQLVCKLTYYQFSFYLHHANPGSIDCPDTISNYSQLLRISSESKQFAARVEKLFLETTDLLRALRCLCTSPSNRQAMITNHEFQKAITNLLLREGENEIECALNLLLTYLTEGQPNERKDLAKGKRNLQTSELPPQDSRETTRKEVLSHFPEIAHQLEGVLASPHGNVENLKNLCSAVLLHIRAHPG